MAKTITSANSVFTLSVPDVNPTPQTLQGYGVDDAFSGDDVDTAEVVKGVDGLKSSGFVPYIPVTKVVLQANSPSIDFMESWLSANLSAQEDFLAQCTILLPGLNKLYVGTDGTLKRAKPIPDAKKVLQAQTYEIHWDTLLPQPAQ